MGSILDKIKGFLPGNNEKIEDTGGNYTLPIVLAVVFIVLIFVTAKVASSK